jgi:predicted porin
MNKKLIAMAVAGACVAPAAMAQTANPVTLYGRIYVNFQSVEAGGSGTPIVRRNRVEDHNSYLGVRGTEDLGGGLKAFFQLETQFKADQNDTTFANRNSGVGLQGGWGSILLGRWDSPMKTTQTAVDPWGDNELGDITGAALRQGGFSQRWQNTVQYWTPNWAGFAARLMYVANEARTSTINPRATGASLSYTAGPLYLAYAYEKHQELVGATATDNVDEKGNAFAGAFTFGPVKLSGQYGEYTRTGTEKQKSFQVGMDWFFGNNHILGSYSKSKYGGASGGAQPECKLAAVGYRYDFSRRTSFMANYTKVDNETGNLCNFGQSALAGIAAGQDPKGVSVGVRHVF